MYFLYLYYNRFLINHLILSIALQCIRDIDQVMQSKIHLLMVEKNYYQILGVTSEAEDVVIRAAYRALVQKYHPDKHTGDGITDAKRALLSDQVREIQEAYQVLSNAKARAQYDKQKHFEDANTYVADSALLTQLESVSWNALLDRHPKFKQHFSQLEVRQPEVAREYKTLVLELLSQGMLSRAIRKLSSAKDDKDTININ
jgi:curved DNA-binding protein CbpA